MPPLTPTGVSGEAAETSVTLAWDRSPCATGYQLRWRLASSPGVWRTATTTRRTYTVGSLTRDTEYCFQVLARNAGGDSDYSPELCVTTEGPVVPPDPPESPALVKGENKLTLSWSEPLDDGGSEITGYVVELLDGDRNLLRTKTPGALARSYVFTGLEGGVTYRGRVAAVNVAGKGDPALAVPVQACGWSRWVNQGSPSWLSVVADVSGATEELSGFVGTWNGDSRGIWSGGGDSGWMAVIEGAGAWRGSLVQFFKTTSGYVSIQLRNVDTDTYEYQDPSVTVQTGAVYVTGALNNFSTLGIVFDGVHIRAVANRPDGVSGVGYVSWIPPARSLPGGREPQLLDRQRPFEHELRYVYSTVATIRFDRLTVADQRLPQAAVRGRLR